MAIHFKSITSLLSNHQATTILMFLLLLFLLSPIASSADLCHPDDKAAILKFKKNLPLWNSDGDCCDIFDCDQTTHRVIRFVLTHSNLAGTIPDSIGDLTYLNTVLITKMPFLVGEIPQSVTKLKYVDSFEISWTNVSGNVPPFLSELKNVWILNLSYNNLSGLIPSSLATLPHLIRLDLSRNRLTGSIPESFGHLVSPNSQGSLSLILSYNMLFGEIPKSVGNTNFNQFDVSRNNLSGDASMLFGALKNTWVLDISRNNFEFDLSSVSFMTHGLSYLDLSHNKIYGKISSQIMEAIDLQYVNVSYNRLCGKIPSPWKLKYEGLDNTSFLHNRCLCGSPLAPCK
ncbi:polygalacturonase inhibitor [Lactuca sativa]|uniref:polygalacturonase inhibitor n=1 Tax=Lactuca sativa TaxID=4236 RepID=UPI000CD81E23|nr:polygalacturonase inhibitor [Lactuca sativa]